MKFVTMGWLAAAGVTMPAIALAQAAPPASAPAAAAPASAPAASAAPASAPAAAAAPATLATGATVLDTSGGTVGAIQSVDGDYVILATTKSKVRLPKTSFALTAKGPIIAMTAAQIDAAAAQAAPPPAAAATTPTVAQGTAVSDMQGAAVGTVASVDGQIATLQLAGGGKVRLPVTAFGAGGANGGLKIAMSEQQLAAAAGAAPK